MPCKIDKENFLIFTDLDVNSSAPNTHIYEFKNCFTSVTYLNHNLFNHLVPQPPCCKLLYSTWIETQSCIIIYTIVSIANSLSNFDPHNFSIATMATNETPWDQNPGYLAMTTTFVLPGGPTSYGKSMSKASSPYALTDVTAAVPRPQGPAPGDVTSFHPG